MADGEQLGLAGVNVDVLLRFLTLPGGDVPGRPGGNVYSIRDGRNGVCAGDDQPAAGGDLGVVRVPGDAGSVDARNPVPRGRAARTSVAR